MHTDDLPPPPQTPPMPTARLTIPYAAPGVWAALGLIALYFLLQIASGSLAGMATTVLAMLTHAQQGLAHIDTPIEAMLQRSGTPAARVMLALVVAAPLTLLLAYRKWPQLWSLALPPGFGFTLPQRQLYFALAIAMGVAAPVLGGWLTELLARGHAVTQDIRQLGNATPPGLRILLVLLVVSLGPLVEELLFRGVLLSALMQRWRVGWAVAISSLLFALVHLQGLDFLWYAVPNLALMAAALAWLRLRSGSIWPAVLMHGVNNLLAVAAWFVAVKPPG